MSEVPLYWLVKSITRGGAGDTLTAWPMPRCQEFGFGGIWQRLAIEDCFLSSRLLV